MELKPKQTEKLKVNEAEPLETTCALSHLTNDQIELFVRQREINPAIEAALRKIMAQKNVVADLAAQMASVNAKKQRIFADQQRIRENLKALKGTAEERALVERYTQQLADQENQLEDLQKQDADLQAKRERAQSDLDKMIQNLTPGRDDLKPCLPPLGSRYILRVGSLLTAFSDADQPANCRADLHDPPVARLLAEPRIADSAA